MAQSLRRAQSRASGASGCANLGWPGMQAGQPLEHPPAAYVTALLVPQGGAIVADTASLEALGIR